MNNIDAPHCEEVIISRERRGTGIDIDPFRLVLKVHSKSGELLAEKDEWISPEHLWLIIDNNHVTFAKHKPTETHDEVWSVTGTVIRCDLEG